MFQVLIVVLLIVCVYTIEKGDYPNISPLEELLRYSYAINLLILVLLCSLIILLVNRYVLHGYLTKFLSLF